MPVIEIMSNSPLAPPGLLASLCHDVGTLLHQPVEKVWALWHQVSDGNHCVPHWPLGSAAAPIVKVHCRSVYSNDQVRDMMLSIARSIAESLAIDARSIFVLVDRVHPYHLLYHGEIWQSDT